MSTVKIRTAFETALAAMTPAISIAYENVPYTANVGVPYAQPRLMMAAPDNPTFGGGYYRERGIFSVMLVYPIGQGSGAATTRAELLKTTFKRGNSYSSGGVTVNIERTPEIAIPTATADGYSVPVKIRFWADIQS